jgi:oxygen-independent coproporphyrinogen-3 oxidase
MKSIYRQQRIIRAFGYNGGITADNDFELYDRLVKLTGRTLPWGAFTGVRPIRYIRENREQIADFRISADKLALADEIIGVQAVSGESPVHCYAGIPFCPSRCKYCSFVSESVGKSHKLIPQYCDLLVRELQMYREREFSAVYVGGGTPTAIPAKQLERLLACIDVSANAEYTVEAGRPETLTHEALRVIKGAGANRISINPQSMNEQTLHAIGRGHSVSEVYDAYERARGLFDVVNMDLIMLPHFIDSLNRVIELQPENITVHSFARKRAAGFTADCEDYTATACAMLKKAGYSPYYLYRQSDSVGDSIGYTRELSKLCLYNVYMTDESSTVLGAGCGAATRVFRGGKTVKHYNFKYPYEYISRFNEILNKEELL